MLLAKANGMSNRRAFVFVAAAILTTMGSISATVPVLLTKAPIEAVASMTRRNNLSSLFPDKRNKRPLIIFANPVWKIAPPTTNKPIIMITTELENPDSPSSGVKIWQISNINNEQIATKSERTFPLMKKIAATTKIAMVIHISVKRLMISKEAAKVSFSIERPMVRKHLFLIHGNPARMWR